MIPTASAIAAQGLARSVERARRQLLLDANADAPVHPRVLDTYLEACSAFADVDASHTLGLDAARALRDATTRIAELLGCSPEALSFTSGGTEADAVALATLSAHGAILVSSIEHAAVAKAVPGCARLPVGRSGFIDVNLVARMLGPGIRGVSVVAASNETGAIQPVSSIADVVHRHGAWLHTDAIQLPGRADLDVMAIGADLITFSSHKLGAPAGVGLVVTPRGLPLSRTWTAAPPNVAGIVAMAQALELLPTVTERAAMARCRDALEAAICAALPDAWIVAGTGPRLSNTSCIAFPGCEGEAILMALDVRDIAVSTGSACSSGSIEASPILLGMGLRPHEAKSTTRFSLARPLTAAQIGEVAATVAEVVTAARSTMDP